MWGKEKEGYIRQLTPLECEHLIGLPEDWTAIGNTICVACAEYIMAVIAEVL